MDGRPEADAGFSTSASGGAFGRAAEPSRLGITGSVPVITSPAPLDRLTHRCEIIETGNESWRFKHRA